MLHRPSAAPLLVALALLAALSAHARDDDQDRALRAVQAGQVMPLPQVLDRLVRTHPGQVLDVELEDQRGAWVYEIRLLQPDGRRVKLDVDARSGEVLRARGHGTPQR